MEISRHKTNEVLRQEVAELEHRWASAALAGHETTLRRLLADHVVVTFFDGSVAHGRHAAVEGIRALRAALHDIDVTHADVRLLGPEAALVTGRAVLDWHPSEQAPDGPVRYTRVWHRQHERWQIVAAHISHVSS